MYSPTIERKAFAGEGNSGAITHLWFWGSHLLPTTMSIVMDSFRASLFQTLSLIVQQPVAQLARAQDETAMPWSTHPPISVLTGHPELLSELKTRIQSRAALAVKGFGSRSLRSMRSLAEAWQEPEIWQWLIAKMPWGHTSRVLDRVKGQHTRDWHLRASLEPGWSQIVLSPRIAARKEAACGENL
jgi:hypothetical protein